jgi:protein-S-isoprenylcysteine O-methyltransferase Ste14
MSNSFWGNPLFWIGIYLIGYIITIMVLSLPGMLTKIENKMPKPLIRTLILLTFIGPPVALPFTKGPKIRIPTPVALTVGIILLGINFIIKGLGQKEIGVIPALKSKGKLVTTGVYEIVRNPLYLSNGLLAIGMALLFRSMSALLFSIPYFLFYLPLIHFEEKDLLEKYGEEYEDYKKKVPWRIIPKLF